MTWRVTVLPALSVLALTFAAILPWGLPSDYRFVLPLLPVVAIYYWTRDDAAWLPEWVLFLCGLLLDVLTQGPLGYWALVYLVAYIAAVYASRSAIESPRGKVALFTTAIITVTFFAWLAASAYFLELLDWKPYARGAFFALILAALVQLALVIAKPSKSATSLHLTRGD
jgi:rod shape-determining protein MreD